MLPIVINILLVIHVIVSLLIIFLVLMQRPKNEGLGAAFGGGMTENLFGAQTTNVLQTITRWFGGIFFCLTILLSFLYVRQTTQKAGTYKILSAPTVIPTAPATPAPDGTVPAESPALPEAASAPVTPGEAMPAPATPAPDATPVPVPAPDAASPAVPETTPPAN